jgi:hypothetical protein
MLVEQRDDFLDGFYSALVSTQSSLTLLQKVCDCKRVFLWALQVIIKKKKFYIV